MKSFQQQTSHSENLGDLTAGYSHAGYYSVKKFIIVIQKCKS